MLSNPNVKQAGFPIASTTEHSAPRTTAASRKAALDWLDNLKPGQKLHWRTDQEMIEAGLDPETGYPLEKAKALKAAGLNPYSGKPENHPNS